MNHALVNESSLGISEELTIERINERSKTIPLGEMDFRLVRVHAEILCTNVRRGSLLALGIRDDTQQLMEVVLKRNWGIVTPEEFDQIIFHVENLCKDRNPFDSCTPTVVLEGFLERIKAERYDITSLGEIQQQLESQGKTLQRALAILHLTSITFVTDDQEIFSLPSLEADHSQGTEICSEHSQPCLLCCLVCSPPKHRCPLHLRRQVSFETLPRDKIAKESENLVEMGPHHFRSFRRRTLLHSSQKRKQKKVRASHFAEWLMSTFGKDFLLAGGVWDVAGGKGEVGLALAQEGIPATVIDPMPVRLSEYKTKRFLSQRGYPSFTPPPTFSSSAFLTDNVKEKRQWLHSKGWQRFPEEVILSSLSTLPLRQCQELFNEEFLNCHMEEWKHCSMIVGLHPDEATEPIIDMALRFDKPMAVVPCCVFPLSNPHRRTSEGRPVREYEDFISYLMAKDPSLQLQVLPDVPGRNIVIYRTVEREQTL